MLAKQAVLGRELRTLREKYALSMSDITEYAKANPALTGAAIGAGGGALFGGLSNLAKDPEDRQTGRGLLTGALAGGALGLGVGHLAPKVLGGQFSGQQPLEDPIQKKLDELNQQSEQINKEWASQAPTMSGSVARTGLLTAPTIGATLAERRLKPEDLTRVIQEGKNVPPSLNPQMWDQMKDLDRRGVINKARYPTAGMTPGDMPAWRRGTRSVSEFLRDRLGLPSQITDPINRGHLADLPPVYPADQTAKAAPKGKPPPSSEELINLAKRGREGRLKLEPGTGPFKPTVRGIGKGLGFAGGAALLDYLIRSGAHQFQQPS
jgi:hypothetical protein